MNYKLLKKASVLALGCTMILSAQNKSYRNGGSPAPKRTCGTMEHDNFLKQTRPGYAQESAKYAQMIEEYLKQNPSGSNAKSSQAIVTVPVVVHVIYKTATENISDPQAASQVQVLNDDFAKLNADASKVTQASFVTAQAGANIRFCLAQRDPQGNPTTGVTHTQTTLASFGTDDKVKKTSTGGHDAWDVSKYVNIWVCNLGTSLLGYGEFPTGTLSNTYGLVLHYKYTGSGGSATSPYNLGRTGTHEFGHCFNLFHIWGDEAACAGSDQCGDTPNQGAEHYGQIAAGSIKTDACTAGGDGVMWMNYMDYTDDACMYMFTANQCARMNAVVNTAPYNVLANSLGCTPVNLVSLDASIQNVTAPTGVLCNTTINPIITLKNFGSTALTSCTISYKIDNGTASTYNWTGSLASLATMPVNLPAITTTNGAHTLTVTSSNPNAGVDGNGTNDASTASFTVVGTGQALPYLQNFETPSSVAALQISNPDGGIGWATTTTANNTSGGSTSMYMDIFNYSGGSKQIDEFTLPSVDLTQGSGTPYMTFDHSYTYWTVPYQFSDTLKVYTSTDCGLTWTQVYNKYGAALQTAPPVSSNSVGFVPSGATQWKKDTIFLSAVSSSNNVMIKFKCINDYEDNLYLDNINIDKLLGINKYTNDVRFDVWPNPNNGMFNVVIHDTYNAVNTNISVYNAVGALVTVESKHNNGVFELNASNLAPGFYNVLVKTEDGKQAIKKLIIAK